MEKFKAILVETAQGGSSTPVVTATKVNFSFQNNVGPIGTAGDSLSDGNFEISADLDILLANGQTLTSKMPTISRRLAELETLLSKMKSGDPDKAKLESEMEIWKTMLSEMQASIGKALKFNYELQNPIQ